MNERRSSKNGSEKPGALRRYHFLRFSLATRGVRVIDLHRAFCRASAADGKPAVHASFFYRVLTGEKQSARIRAFVARFLRIPTKELWA